MPRTMRTAIDLSGFFDPMPDDPGLAVSTTRRELIDGAFKAVKDMLFTRKHHRKSFVIDVPAVFTRRILHIASFVLFLKRQQGVFRFFRGEKQRFDWHMACTDKRRVLINTNSHEGEIIMKKGNKSVFAIFEDRGTLGRAIEALKSANFRNSDISVLMPTMGDEETFAHEKASKAPEGAAVGAGVGAVLGGAFGWLVGIGAIAVAPPLGLMIAAGPIMSALAAAGAAGALGGVAGSLVGLGIPEYEAKRYESIVKDGGILLSVHVDDSEWLQKAERILEDVGARDVSSTSEVSAEGDRPSPQGAYKNNTSTSPFNR